MIFTERLVRSSFVIACLAACCGTGCTSVISSAYLRDAFWETAEHAAETEADSASTAEPDEAALAAADADRREAAIEEAVSRLSRLGGLDEAARATLIETLERTSQEDWPAVVDVFAESLGETGMRTPEPVAGPATTADSATPEPHVVAKADLDTARPDPPAVTTATPPTAIESAETASEPPAAAGPDVVASAPEPPPTVTEPAADASSPAGDAVPAGSAVSMAAAPLAAVSDPIAPPPVEPADKLAVRNACFATRVQAWGVVDRFAVDRFRPGQDVIVYFELDGLSAGASPAGHTTCIDTTLRLRAADGSQLHDWTFEPIAETCRARRHDYFARYVVRIPESAGNGDCRLEIAVTDTLSGAVADATLPLAISARSD